MHGHQNVQPEAAGVRRHHFGQLKRAVDEHGVVSEVNDWDDAPSLRYPILLIHVHADAVGLPGNHVYVFGQKVDKERSMNGSKYMVTRSLPDEYDVQALGGILRLVRNLPHYHAKPPSAADKAAAIRRDPSLAGGHELLQGRYMETDGFVFARIFRDPTADDGQAPWYDSF